MKPSDFQKTVMCRFDSCLKKTVFGVVKDYYKELKKNQAEAIPFCELPDIIIDKVAIWDTYKTDYTTFNICGHDIYVYDDELAKVIFDVGFCHRLCRYKRRNIDSFSLQ